MKNLKYEEIRSMYLEYMKQNGHAIIPSASLVPENDPTVLFVNSGMFPLVPFLLGEDHPEGTRIADSQRSLRTIDIDEVGDRTHCTTFEMLGNWSLNDYFKEEAIPLTMKFFVEELGIDANNIYASVFGGNGDAPKDDLSIEVWKGVFKEYGIEAEVGPKERIQLFDKSENWWELAGGGPCGPCTEIFYDTGREPCSEECNVSCSCEKYVELGNNVLMEYLKEGDSYKPLGRHNVDFGGGLERLAMISQGTESVFETDIYAPILSKVQELSTEGDLRSERIIVDHLKAATWIIMDGVLPGPSEREYILRRIIRRAVRHGRKLGIQGEFTAQVAEVAIDQFKGIWGELETQREHILNTLSEEEKRFNETVDKGLREFEKKIDQSTKDGKFNNQDGFTFMMYETYGFPLEMSFEELRSRDIKFNEDEVQKLHAEAYQQHQEKSRSASKGFFKGGLADTTEESTKLHTATHLLLAALYEVVGDHVNQRGSNITPERLRLDFPNDQKLTPEQLQQVEELVNQKIQEDLPISWVEMDKDEALELVRYASFAEKYGDKVKVYTMGDKENPFSEEICNGPHVESTGQLGKFKIKKQENVAAGVKRIKAILE